MNERIHFHCCFARSHKVRKEGRKEERQKAGPGLTMEKRKKGGAEFEDLKKKRAENFVTLVNQKIVMDNREQYRQPIDEE